MRNILFDGTLYPCVVWSPKDGAIGPCSFDSETTLIESGKIPDFIIATAYNGRAVYFITRADLPAFIRVHMDTPLYMANAAFDIRVAERLCGPLWQLVESGKVVDILLLKQLVELANFGVADQRWNLDRLTQLYVGVHLAKTLLDKDGNEIRTSFAQFLDRHEMSVAYDEIPWDYLSYAGTDAVATFKVAIRLLDEAQSTFVRCRVDDSALLSHRIQLKASYAFSSLTALGLGIDLRRVASAREEIERRLSEASVHLRAGGWEPAGADNSLREIIGRLAYENGVSLPKTSPAPQ